MKVKIILRAGTEEFTVDRVQVTDLWQTTESIPEQFLVEGWNGHIKFFALYTQKFPVFS